jgi:DNA end-binding protein Ku
MAREEERGGLSTPRKVVAGAALGIALPAAVAGARKLITGDGPDDKSRESSKKAERPKRTTRRPRAAAKKRTATAKKTASRTTRTREQLYRQATRLKIPGRSRMTKSQLERAVDRVRGRS